MLARYARKLVEEVIERMTGFEVIDEGLHGNASPSEYGSTTKAFWRARDQRVWQYGHVDSPMQGHRKIYPAGVGRAHLSEPLLAFATQLWLSNSSMLSAVASSTFSSPSMVWSPMWPMRNVLLFSFP